MAELLALDCLPVGKSAYVANVYNEPSMRRRLTDLGMTPGTRILCLYRSPAGDPTAYLIRGAIIALRRRDAAQVQVRPVTVPS